MQLLIYLISLFAVYIVVSVQVTEACKGHSTGAADSCPLLPPQ